MTPKTGKKLAAAANLELYWDVQWQSWGLIDPDGGRVESLWFSAGEIRTISPETFRDRYIAMMVERLAAK